MGDIDGRYKCMELVGSGHHGRVYKALDKQTDETVAVKCIDLIQGDERRAHYEIENHQQLDHENVIPLRQVIHEGKYRVYLVMDYADRNTLRSLLMEKGGPLSEDEARYFFRQLIGGVAYCHGRNIVSRDIKLRNILLKSSPDGGLPIIKLCDFGFSKKLDITDPRSMVGTWDYMAPEVLEGQAKETYDGMKVDIWACGSVLYHMVTFSCPFTLRRLGQETMKGSTKQLIQRILEAKYSLDSDISPECKDLIRRCFERDPENRITMEQIQKHPWYIG